MIPYLEAFVAYVVSYKRFTQDTFLLHVLKSLVRFKDFMIQEKPQNAEIHSPVLPLALQHGKALAYIIYCHFKELIR